MEIVLGVTCDIGITGSGVDPRPEDDVDEAATATVAEYPR